MLPVLQRFKSLADGISPPSRPGLHLRHGSKDEGHLRSGEAIVSSPWWGKWRPSIRRRAVANGEAALTAAHSVIGEMKCISLITPPPGPRPPVPCLSEQFINIVLSLSSSLYFFFLLPWSAGKFRGNYQSDRWNGSTAHAKWTVAMETRPDKQLSRVLVTWPLGDQGSFTRRAGGLALAPVTWPNLFAISAQRSLSSERMCVYLCVEGGVGGVG